eukprot:gb/GECG01002881.1/.p1 GENE.gb/GECG01002881.1/~~gb/GECG01002881.1/.p1  ORF type:complete len:516 (+),score=56.80 gb/GECG01002881.1/:1-1548(+)
MSQYPVRLRCYDLSQGMAAQFAPMFGLQLEAIWHTGIEYQGIEYFFSGGIQARRPQQVEATFGLRPVKVLELGNTTKSKQELESFLNSIRHRYTAATYDLFNHNCNHFTDEVSRFLLGHGIPSEIVQLPQTVLNSQLGQMLRPMIDQMEGRFGVQNDPFAAMQQGGAATGGSIQSQQGQGTPQNNQVVDPGASSGSLAPTERQHRKYTSSQMLQEAKKPITWVKLERIDDLLRSLSRDGVDENSIAKLRKAKEALCTADSVSLKNNSDFPGIEELAETLVELHSKLVNQGRWCSVAVVLMFTRNLILYPSGADRLLQEDRFSQLFLAHLRRHRENKSGEQTVCIALANLANALVSHAGQKIVLEKTILSEFVSSILHLLNCGEALCRRMASAVLFNLSISLREARETESVAHITGSLEEADTSIFCGAMEMLPKETQPIVIFRYLLSILSLIQTRDGSPKELFHSLGMQEVIDSVLANLARVATSDSSASWDQRDISDQIRAAGTAIKETSEANN